MRKKSQLHRDLEAGRIEAIVIIGKGMSNPKKMTSQIWKKYLMKVKKLSKILEMTRYKGRNPWHLHQHWQK